MSLENSKRGIPGPGEYHHLSTIDIKGQPKYGFSQESRNGAYIASSTPGPGQYEHKEVVGKDGPSKSMSTIIAYNPIKKEAMGKPGPGSY